MKTIAAMMLAGAFLIAQPAFAAVVVGADGKAVTPVPAKKVAKKDKAAKKDEKTDDKKAEAPKADEPKKEEKKPEKGGW